MSIRVAIIDSGVNPRHPHVSGIVEGRCFVPGEPPERYLDYLGHGTAVAGAICEKSPEASLYIAKVFHQQLVTSIEILLQALDWCLAQPVTLVNLSLGTANAAHRDAFLQRVTEASARGIRLVSPAAALPGSLPGVVGVKVNDALDRELYQINPDGTYSASGYPRPIPGRAPTQNFQGISFAVANVTGFLARTQPPQAS